PKGLVHWATGQTFPIKGTGGGTITGITTTSPLTGSGTSGSVALGLNESTLVTDITPSLESTFNSVYPQLGTSNTFNGEVNNFNEVQAGQGKGTGYSAIVGYGLNGSYGVSGSSDTGLGV